MKLVTEGCSQFMETILLVKFPVKMPHYCVCLITVVFYNYPYLNFPRQFLLVLSCHFLPYFSWAVFQTLFSVRGSRFPKIRSYKPNFKIPLEKCQLVFCRHFIYWDTVCFWFFFFGKLVAVALDLRLYFCPYVVLLYQWHFNNWNLFYKNWFWFILQVIE